MMMWSVRRMRTNMQTKIGVHHMCGLKEASSVRLRPHAEMPVARCGATEADSGNFLKLMYTVRFAL